MKGGRLGSSLLFVGGIALAGLMAYTLTLGESHSPEVAPRMSPEIADVAVFFPDRIDWRDFRMGVSECARRGLVSVESDSDDQMVVQTPLRHRLIRFGWNGARGRQGTWDAARRLSAPPGPPLAVVGSGNTSLTADLAEALQRATNPGASASLGFGPVLLIPWATSVLVDGPDDPTERVPLLEIDPGRTFRFCPNNRALAGQVVRCLADSEPSALPSRVVMVVDDHDPYSVDLADGFSRAIREVAPKAEFEEQDDPEPEAGMNDVPGANERRWAENLWQRAEGYPTWVVLPLQAEPAKRLLLALRGLARERSESRVPIRVLCGDAVGVDALTPLLGPHAVPVWTASPASAPAPGLGVAHDAQVPAEIVSALAHCLDADPDDDLAATMLRLHLKADDPAAFGRTLNFEPSGERAGLDLGLVLAVRPGRGEVLAYSRGSKGAWNPPVPIPPAIQVVR